MSKWKETILEIHSSLITKGTTPTSLGRAFQESGINFIKAESINDAGEFLPSYFAHIDEETHEILKRSQLQEGDILFSIAGVLGRIAIVNSQILPANTNQAIALIRLSNSSKVVKEYLKYFLNSEFIKDQIRRINVQAAQANFSLGDINRLYIQYPEEKSEQQKIASILSTCDTVIEKTQAAIAKYKAIKQGMLHDLFTRGIDIKTGKLRPKYKDAPELYKESKLGWVPKEWEVDVLDNICDVTSSKRIYMNEYIEFGIPFYRSLEIILKSKNQEIGTTLYISKEKYETIEKQFGVPKYGDILITSVGTLGISYRVSINDLFYFKDGNLIWFRDFKNEEYSRFLLHSLNDLIRLQFDKITIGTSQKAFTIDKLKKLNIYVPKENETKLICTRIEMVNNKLQTEEKYLHKLQQIKAGLMGDLLSGKKKVKV